MKILFITPFLPINNGSGGSIRSYQLYEELRSFANVDVLIANGSGISFPLLKKFKMSHNYVGHIEIYWDQAFFEIRKRLHPELRSILDKGNYSYVFIRYYNTAYWLGALGLESLILDCDDCRLELLSQQVAEKKANVVSRIFIGVLEYIRCINYIKNISLVKKVIFSKKSYKIEWKDNFLVIPNRISLVEGLSITKKTSTKIKILFVGVLNYFPNVEGLDYFIENIWPLIFEKRSSVTLKIVGNFLSPYYKSKWLTHPGIEYMGFVEHIEDVYSDIDFSIAPVYQGSGTHIKIMESLMQSKPMVISKLAHRGYEDTLLDGESLFVANDDNDFAKKIILLIDDEELRINMSVHGYKKVVCHHSINKDSMSLRKILIGRAKESAPPQLMKQALMFKEPM